MKRVANSGIRRCVNARQEFKNAKGSCYGTLVRGRYVVYSYGTHWPLYVFEEDKWFGNKTRYSRTTTRHTSCARPDGDIMWVGVDTLCRVIHGGIAAAAAHRMGVGED